MKNRIRELRLARQLSQAELADRIGVNKQAISQYERGVRHPKPEIMDALTDFFNVSSDYLMAKEDVSTLVLTENELALLDIFRQMSDSEQHLALRMLRALQNQEG